MKLKQIALDKVIWISVAIIAFLAWQDTVGASMWKLLGGWEAEAYTKASPVYMQQFWLFAYALIAVVALTYWFIKKDKSESLALITTPIILLWSGWEDIIYYIIGGHQFFGTTMPWLYENCFFMRWVAQMMGQTTVTDITLIVSATLGAVIAYYTYKWLKRFERKNNW